MNILQSAKEWKMTILGLLGIVVSALLLRLYNLNLIPVFADEAIYVRWAQVMRAEQTLRFLPLSDGKQPLYMWTVMPVLKVIEDPLVAGRAVSVIAGMGTLIGIFALSYILFKSKKVSLLSALLYALSPFAVFFDRMALVDSMLSMFGIWSLIFSILAVKYKRLDFAFLCGFSIGGGLLTKSPAIFFVTLLPLSLLFIKVGKRKERVLNFIKAIALLVVAGSMGYGIYNILRLGPNFQLIGARNYDYVYPFTHFFENAWDPFLPQLDRSIWWYKVIGPSAILLMAIVGILGNLARYRKEVVLLTLWAVFPILVQSEFAKVFTARYIFFTVPYFMILGALFINRFKNKFGALLLIGLFLVQCMLFYIPFFTKPSEAYWPDRAGYFANWTAGVGIKEVAEFIKKEHEEDPNRQIVVGTEGYFGTLPDGLQIYLEKIPNIVVMGVGLGISEIPESLKESVKSGNKTYLVANSSRLKFRESFDYYGLKTVLAFEKAQRDIGSREYKEDGDHDIFYLLEVTN